MARDLLEMSSHIFKPEVQRRLRQCLEAALPLGADGLPLGDAEEFARPAAAQYLVCKAERDLSVLLPLLPKLAQTDR